MIPRTFVNLRVNPRNEAEVLGQYVGPDGAVSDQWYLVATMSGNPAARHHTAVQLAASERIRQAAETTLDFLKELGDCRTDVEASDFIANYLDTVESALTEALNPCQKEGA